jgi:hypothetical protein
MLPTLVIVALFTLWLLADARRRVEPATVRS